MPRDVAPNETPRPSVIALADGPLGPRFRVRGLLGNPAFARWLEATLGATDIHSHASADTGIVRIDAKRSHHSGAELGAELEACVEQFGAVPGRAPTRRRAKRADAPGAGARHATGAQAPATSPKTSTPAPPWPRTPPSPRSPRTPPSSDIPAQPAAAPADERAWHSLSLQALQAELTASVDGLTASEAAARRARDGANKIPDVLARSNREILVDQFKSVPVALLAGSGALALGTRAFADASAIATVLGANGAIGYFTERQAERTVSALRNLAPRAATVLRDGRECLIAAHDVVVGDVLVLKPGERVAADARVIEAHRLSANEASLTGESLPVRKDVADGLARDTPLAQRPNMLYMGTAISGGTGRALVVATGERTMLGAIRALAQTGQAPRTRLQTELDGLGKRLAIGATGLCAGVLLLGLLRGRAPLPMLRTAVSLGVAAIPEGLPTVATSLLAAGIRKLQRRNVFARRLDAVENLGAIDVVGFDKTGTLTQNRMSVASVVVGSTTEDPEGLDPHTRLPDDWRLVAALCHELQRGDDGWQGSSTELALVDFVRAHGTDVDALSKQFPRIEIKDRSEHHPYMVTLHAPAHGLCVVAVKGRPAEVLERCTTWLDGARTRALTQADRKRLLTLNDTLAGRGHRVLALAITRQKGRSLGTTGRLTWLGLVGLADPLRPRIAESIARFKAAGIRPLMITGDQPGTAQAVARAIGLDGDDRVLDASAFAEDPAALGSAVERTSGFARSTPAMKLAIIQALQNRGHVVAMTGDGINDGPALKVADVGVAMGASGTDFAHAMSDLVLKDDHPDGLLEAIAEGRTAYLNVKKAVRYLVATNVSELAVMAIAVAAGLPDPLDPMALLWINLITDVSPAIALGLEPPEPDILQRPPFPRADALFSARDWRGVLIDGGAITGATLAAFAYGLARYGPTPRARTLAFMAAGTSQLVYALAARSEAPLSIFGNGRLRANPWLFRTVALSLGAQAATVLFPPLRSLLRTTPIGIGDAAVIVACAVAPSLLREGLKRMRPAAHPAKQPAVD